MAWFSPEQVQYNRGICYGICPSCDYQLWLPVMATKKQFGSFQELINQSELPVLVDFYAPWCGPCQMMAGMLEQLNSEMKQRLRIVKINTENYPQLASQYQVRALPTLVLFKQGEPTLRIEGVLPVDQLKQRLRPYT
jgi:thioredoxin